MSHQQSCTWKVLEDTLEGLETPESVHHATAHCNSLPRMTHAYGLYPSLPRSSQPLPLFLTSAPADKLCSHILVIHGECHSKTNDYCLRINNMKR